MIETGFPWESDRIARIRVFIVGRPDPKRSDEGSGFDQSTQPEPGDLPITHPNGAMFQLTPLNSRRSMAGQPTRDIDPGPSATRWTKLVAPCQLFGSQ